MSSSLENAKIMAEFNLDVIKFIQGCESSGMTQNPDVSDFLNLMKAWVEAGSKTPLSEIVSNFTRSEAIPTPCTFAEFANAFNRGIEPDDSQKVTEIPSEESEDELLSEPEEAGYAAAAAQPAQPAQPKIRNVQMALAVYGQDNMKFINDEGNTLEVPFSIDLLRYGTFYHLHGPFDVHGKKLVYNGSAEDFAIETAVFEGRIDSFNDSNGNPHMKIVSDNGKDFFCSDDFLTKYQLWEEDKKHVKFSAFQTIDDGKIARNRKGEAMIPSVFDATLVA